MHNKFVPYHFFYTSNLIKINTSLSPVNRVRYELLYQWEYQIVIIDNDVRHICSNIIVYNSEIEKKKG